MQVRWTQSASKDLQAIVRYIRKDNRPAARSVAEKLFNAANSLAQYPLRGRTGRVPGTRELIVDSLPYVIVYRVASEAVHIARIYHGAQDRAV
jgi:toxin ParE1/3/4